MPRKVSKNIHNEFPQEYASNEIQKVKAYVQTLRTSDPEIYKILTNLDDLSLIEDSLGEHYEHAFAIDTRPRRKQGDTRTVAKKINEVTQAFNKR